MKNTKLALALIIAVFLISSNISAVTLMTKFDADFKVIKSPPTITSCIEPYAFTEDEQGTTVIHRPDKYLFEGENIRWIVLVEDLNKIEEIQEVYTTTGTSHGINNDPADVCRKISDPQGISCPGTTSFDEQTMAMYECTFTVKESEYHYGEYIISVEAESVDGRVVLPEFEQWFLNPIVAISIEGRSLEFDELIPGKTSFSNELIIENSGDRAVLDMFLSGTDFVDLNSSESKCPDINRLGLEQFGYKAAKGTISTNQLADADAQGFRKINYGFIFHENFYDTNEILPVDKKENYYEGNILYPQEEMNLQLKIDVPESCSGNYDSGKFYIWAETK